MRKRARKGHNRSGSQRTRAGRRRGISTRRLLRARGSSGSFPDAWLVVGEGGCGQGGLPGSPWRKCLSPVRVSVLTRRLFGVGFLDLAQLLLDLLHLVLDFAD